MKRPSRRIMNRHRSGGYSLMEILVVIAIIGILSLVTVPAFMNFQRRNQVRSALRSFTTDLRSFRQLSISRNAYVRVRFVDNRNYEVWISRNLGRTWDPLPLGMLGQGSYTRALPETIKFTGNTFNDSDNPVDSLPDVDFRPDGTVGDFSGSTATPGRITLRTDWKDIINQVVVDVSTTGQLKTTESKAS